MVSVLALAALVRPAVSEHYESKFLKGKKNGAADALAVTGENAGYAKALGAVYFESHGPSDLQKAEALFKKSLSENPLDSDAWLWLARVYNDTGRKRLAESAVSNALERSAGAPDVIWNSGVLLLQMDDTDAGVEQFKTYIGLNPGEQRNVYALCMALGLSPQYIQQKLVPPDMQHLQQWLYFLMDSKQQDAAANAWEELLETGKEKGQAPPSDRDYLRYCDFLIESGKQSDALAVWNALFSQTKITHKPGRIWDGGFELPVTEGGFGWRIGKAPGVRIFLDGDIKTAGQYSLSASFDGTSNPDIYIARQIVPVEQGHKYEVSGYIKTSRITTDNGIFLAVQGYNCAGLNASSQTVTGTNYWEKQSIEFTVPPDCNAVWFGIRRAVSDKLDNKISGDVWIDQISMSGQD